MSRKLTPWFPAASHPARQGYYEIRGTSFGGDDYRRWDGAQWSCTYSRDQLRWCAPREARGVYAPGEDMTGWRGLSENPAPGAAQETAP